MKQFVLPLRAYIEDTDYAGVVYHANYLKYFERARSEWAEELGFGINWQQAKNVYFVIASIKIDYLKPVRLNQQFEVVSKIKTIKQVSILYDQHLRLTSSRDTILCRAETKIALVNERLRPEPLPEIVKNLLMET